MKWLARNFLRGILVLVPIALTLYVVFRVFRFMDGHLGPHISGWVGIPIPGVGVVATLVLITLIGVLAANLAARRLFATVERIVARLPFLRTLYTSIRSLVENFAGDNPGFHHPVVVDLTPDGGVRAAGFITNNDLVFLGLAEHVAVYLPQSYNFAGNLLIFPSGRVHPLPAKGMDVMSFVVSAGAVGGKVAVENSVDAGRGNPILTKESR